MDIAEQQVAREPDTAGSAKSRRWQMAAGYAFAALCVVWLLHDVHPRHLLSKIAIAVWAFVVPAVFFDVLTYLLQGWRWSLLLRPAGRLSTIEATQAIYSGLFVNEILPLRIGEGARALLAARWLGIPVGGVIPSMVVERLLDAVCLLLGIGLVSIAVPLPPALMKAGDILGAVVLAGTLVFVLVLVRRERALERNEDGPPRPHSRLGSLLRQFASGLRQIGFSWRLWASLAISASLLLCQGLASWFMMLAFGLKLPVYVGFVVLLIIRLGTAIPNAPANVGSFQFFAVLALGLYGVDKTSATAFSIVDFIVLTVPLWSLGLIAIARSGMTLHALRVESSRIE